MGKLAKLGSSDSSVRRMLFALPMLKFAEAFVLAFATPSCMALTSCCTRSLVVLPGNLNRANDHHSFLLDLLLVV